MNFTREPIIETVITPREGCKLVVRSSKGATTEDYFVDAVEVVSFGHSFFFRSQERPKSFLVPVSDYEILETKETRMVIKNAQADHIKIGGGRDAAPPRQHREHQPHPEQQPRDPALADSRPAPERQPQGQMKRDNNKRRRGRRGRDRHPDQQGQEPRHDQSQEPRGDNQESRGEHSQDQHQENHDQPRNEQQPHRDEHRHRNDHHPRDHHQPREREDRAHQNGESFSAPAANGNEEPVKAPSFISKLFPPPQTLIKETLSRYKPAEEPKPSTDEGMFDHPSSKEDLEDDNEE